MLSGVSVRTVRHSLRPAKVYPHQSLTARQSEDLAYGETRDMMIRPYSLNSSTRGISGGTAFRLAIRFGFQTKPIEVLKHQRCYFVLFFFLFTDQILRALTPLPSIDRSP